MTDDLKGQIRDYARHVVDESDPVDLDGALARFQRAKNDPQINFGVTKVDRTSSLWRGWMFAAMSAAGVLFIVLLSSLAYRQASDSITPTDSQEGVDQRILDGFEGDGLSPDFSGNSSGNPTTREVTDWVAGDDGLGPAPLGEVMVLPGEHYLDFLSRDCEGCFLDARFMGPGLSDYGSGPWVAGRQFYVRQGFVASGSEPLGAGFDVELYLTRWNGPDMGDGVFELGQTYRFTSDYVIRAEAEECGPTYATQSGSVECE